MSNLYTLMNNLHALQIYDDLKACGVPEQQARAQVMNIYKTHMALSEKITMDFSNDIAKYHKKIDINILWIKVISVSLLIAFVGNIAINLYK